MKLQIKKGTTDVTTYLFIQDSSATTGVGKTGLAYNTASLVAYYVRPLGTATAITLATQTAGGAHSDGGFVEVDATNMPGVYRFDLPDAVCATGVNSVVVMLKGAANMAPVVMELELVAYDPQSATDLGLSRLDAAVSTRASQTSLDTVDDFLDTEVAAILAAVDTEVAAIKAKTDNLPSDPADASDIASSFTTVNTKLDTIDDFLDTEIAAIKAKTDNLPTDPADQSILEGKIDTIDDFLDTEIAAIKAKTDLISIIRGNTAQAGAAGSITLDASASGSDDFYNNTIIHITSGTGAGQSRIISDYVGATKVASVNGNWITNPSSDSVFQIYAFGAIPGASAPTAAEVADAVWDEATSGHTTAGSTGKALTDAGSAGDPWSTALPGAYGSGTAGKIIGDNLNATISSRASQTSLDTVDDLLDTEVAAIKTVVDGIQTDLDNATDGLGALKTAIVAVDDLVDTEVAAIKTVVDSILVDTAEIGAAGAGLTALASQASVNTIDDFLDTEIAAIKAKTDNLPSTIKKNTELAGFMFMMIDSNDHITPKTGLTVTATRSLDGAAFGACANSVTEVANGWYKITLAAADLNGNTVALKFTATGADATNISLVTNA